MPKLSKKNLQKNKFYLLASALIILVLGAYGVSRIGSTQASPEAEEEKVALEGPKAETEVNQSFYFPLNNANGEEVGQIEYLIEKAELRDEIITEGRKYTSLEDRQFLTLSLKLKNDMDQAVRINVRDYVRLSMNGEEELFAPTLHSDPVEIQAISSKPTRLGYTINSTDTDLILHVGEITGEKIQVPLSL